MPTPDQAPSVKDAARTAAKGAFLTIATSLCLAAAIVLPEPLNMVDPSMMVLSAAEIRSPVSKSRTWLACERHSPAAIVAAATLALIDRRQKPRCAAIHPLRRSGFSPAR
jgi:hypothetical protein